MLEKASHRALRGQERKRKVSRSNRNMQKCGSVSSGCRHSWKSAGFPSVHWQCHLAAPLGSTKAGTQGYRTWGKGHTVRDASFLDPSPGGTACQPNWLLLSRPGVLPKPTAPPALLVTLCPAAHHQHSLHLLCLLSSTPSVPAAASLPNPISLTPFILQKPLTKHHKAALHPASKPYQLISVGASG